MNDNSKLFAKLKELNDLKEQNLISVELYEQKEREVLERINSNNVYEVEIKKNMATIADQYRNDPDSIINNSNDGENKYMMSIIIIAVVIIVIMIIYFYKYYYTTT